MNPVRRWLRFNVVGVAGMLVQLVTLAGLREIVRGHYLLLSGIAVETAVLHNFVAHVHYTWNDRKLATRSAWAGVLNALWRFQVSNGGVSLAGNLAVMRMLVGGARLPVMMANLISIGVCGLANFWLGERWAFAARRARSRRRLCGIGARLRLVAGVLIVCQAAIGCAQQATAAGLPPSAQAVKEQVERIPADGKMTVRMLNGIVYHGRLDRMEADHFLLREVDLAQTIQVRYAEASRVNANYGGKGWRGQRVDPARSLMIGAAVVAGLLTLVFVAVASDKS